MEPVYSLIQEEQSFPDFRLLYLRQYRRNRTQPLQQRTHPYTEIYFITQGEGIMQIEEEIYPMQEHQCFLIGSHIRHGEYTETDAPLDYYVMGLEGILLHKKNENCYDTSKMHNSGHFLSLYAPQEDTQPYHKEIYHLLSRLREEITDQKAYYRLLSKNLVEQILLTVMRHSPTEYVLERESPIPRQLLYIRHLLEYHCHEELQLTDMADLVHMNRYALVNDFKKHFGTTPIDFLLHQRIAKAQELLLHSDASILDISQKTGFRYQTYFNTVFKKKTGVTPLQFRKQSFPELLKNTENEKNRS